MTIWLAEAQYAVDFFALAAILFIAPWIRVQYRRFGQLRGWPAMVSAATILYVASLVAFTMFPMASQTPGYCARHAGRSYWNLTPFASIGDISAFAEHATVVEVLASGVLLQVIMNVIFFVPFGFLLRYRYRVGWWRTIGFSLVLSLVIELTQGTGLWGLAECPYRLADVDDLLTNTLGGALGWLLAVALGPLLPDPLPRPLADLDRPSRRRRGLAFVLDLQLYALVMLAVLLVDEALSDAPDAGTWSFRTTSIVVSALLFVVIPALLPRRATWGQATVSLALRGRHVGRARWWSLVLRWAFRWLTYIWFGPVALVTTLVIDLVVSLARSDARSLTDLVSGSRLETQRAVDDCDSMSPLRDAAGPGRRRPLRQPAPRSQPADGAGRRS